MNPPKLSSRRPSRPVAMPTLWTMLLLAITLAGCASRGVVPLTNADLHNAFAILEVEVYG